MPTLTDLLSAVQVPDPCDGAQILQIEVVCVDGHYVARVQEVEEMIPPGVAARPLATVGGCHGCGGGPKLAVIAWAKETKASADDLIRALKALK